jgi:hypothetical protein
MPPGACHSYLTKARGFKRGDESHEPVAWRIRVNRIGLNYLCALRPGMLHSGCDKPSSGPLAAELPRHEEAHQRPHAARFIRRTLSAAQVPISSTRSNRAPCNWVFIVVTKDAYGYAFLDSTLQGRLLRSAIAPACSLGHRTPFHAPAVFGPSGLLEQPLQFAPSFGRNLVEYQPLNHEALSLGSHES